MDRAFYVLAYDISDDKHRVKIARLLEAIGERVQGSVFEAYLTPGELTRLTAKSLKVMNEKEDSLRTSSPVPTRVTPTSTRIAPTLLPDEGTSFDFNPIDFGKEAEIEVNGRIIALKVNKVITGQDADQIAFSKAPAEMRWVIIQLLITYVKGEENKRVELLNPKMFEIISKGHLHTSSPWLVYTPNPRLYDVLLLPGENSLGYLAFQVYREDETPLLRFSQSSTELFFNLAEKPFQKYPFEKGYQLTSKTGIGTKDNPVPIGTAAYLEYRQTIYKVTVQKVQYGFDAWKLIHDGWGINKEPPKDQEYVMPYVTVQAVRASSVQSEFPLSIFSVVSKQKNLSQPYNFFCPVPCFSSPILYPQGIAAGWIPLLHYIDDPEPLLGFDDRFYFRLTPTQPEGTYTRKLSPNAIGYSNRDAIKSTFELPHSAPVNALAFSPDDRFLVSVGADKLARVWDVKTGKETTKLAGHKANVKQAAFSLDGRWLATVDASELLIWDALAWKLEQTIPMKGDVIGLKFLPDKTLLAATTAGYLQYWEPSSAKLLKEGSIPRSMSPSCGSAYVHSFDAIDDGSVLAASLSCGYGVIWKRDSGEIIYADINRQNDLRTKILPDSSVISLSPDGKEAAFGMVYYPNRNLMLLDVIDVEKKKVVAGLSPIDLNPVAIRVAPKRDLILSGVGSAIFFWWPEAENWGEKNYLKFSNHASRVTAIQFSTAGEYLATADYGLCRKNHHLDCLVAVSQDSRFTSKRMLGNTCRSQTGCFLFMVHSTVHGEYLRNIMNRLDTR